MMIERRMISVPWLFAASVLLLGQAPLSAQSCPAPASITEDQQGAIAHVRFLADDALEGREAASSGERCAGDYLADQFRVLGLEPAGDDGGFFQSFPVRAGSRLGAGSVLTISTKSHDLGKAWTPFGFSGSARAEAALLYVADGVQRDQEAADTTAPDPFEGRIVVIESAAPGVAPGVAPGSLSADPHFRASVAQGRGALAAVLLLSEGEALPDLSDERRPFVRIPMVAVAADAADDVRAAAVAEAVAVVETVVEARTALARNVVGLLPGDDPDRSGQIVVVGAHYDHLGYGGAGSLAPDSRDIHNGADDNASGTAALLEAARRLSAETHARPVLFIAFTGEEKGLLGSAHFVEDPTVSLEGAVAMINLDMVGRLRGNTLTAYGMATAPEWEALLSTVNGEQPEPFTLALLPDGFGPSDHSSFYGKGIPVVHFFTNTHTEYHRPEDDWQTLNAGGLDRIAALVADLAGALAGAADTAVPPLTPVEGVGNPLEAAPEGEGPSRGYGPYFGSIPDMTPTDYGVRLSGVREDSPADRAGLQAGDVIVSFGDQEVSDLYAFTYALRDRKPGDRITVIVEREGSRLTLYAVLGERR